MPTIPIYESQVNPQPVRTAPISMDNFTAGGRMMSEVGKQLDEIASKFNELDILRKKTKSSVNLQTELDEIAFQADNDPDLDSLPKYQQKIDEAVERNLQIIPQGIARQQAGEEFRLKSYSTFSGVRQSFRRRQIAEQKFLIEDDLSKNQELYITGTPEERVQALAIGNLRIDEGVNAMIFTPEQASVLKEAIVKDWEVSRATSDAQYNPDMFLENPDDYSLSKKDRIEITVLANRNKVKIETDQKIYNEELKRQNVISLTEKFLTGDLKDVSLHEISQMTNAGLLPPEFRQAFNNAITSPKLTEEEIDEDDFKFLINELISIEDIDGVINVLTETLNKTGTARQKELDSIMQFAMSHMQKEGKREVLKTILSEYFNLLTGQTQYKVIKNFIDKVNNNEDPEKARKISLMEVMKEQNPYLMDVREKGLKMMDSNGNVSIVYNDGTIEAVE